MSLVPALPEVYRQLDVCPAGQRLILLIPMEQTGWISTGLDTKRVGRQPVRIATDARLAFRSQPTGDTKRFVTCELRRIARSWLGNATTEQVIQGGQVLSFDSKPGPIDVRWGAAARAECNCGVLQLSFVFDAARDSTDLVVTGKKLMHRIVFSGGLSPPVPRVADHASMALAHLLEGKS